MSRRALLAIGLAILTPTIVVACGLTYRILQQETAAGGPVMARGFAEKCAFRTVGSPADASFDFRKKVEFNESTSTWLVSGIVSYTAPDGTPKRIAWRVHCRLGDYGWEEVDTVLVGDAD